LGVVLCGSLGKRDVDSVQQKRPPFERRPFYAEWKAV